ncbi:MAG: hypothetical protein IIC64_03015 [SAR324 cluster bacterium]|nr:hypothetical protein [SAR324 cluster bacterium]
MSKKDNVISLEERRRQAAGAGTGDSARKSARKSATVEPPGAAVSKNTAQEKTARETTVPENTVPEKTAQENPVPGQLIWLHCPSCDTLEYTEMAMPGGRVHNCGTHVVEAGVELDLRAEHTLTRINLERLTLLENLLAGQRRNFEEYLQRLSLAARKPLEAYSFSEALLEKLPIAEVDAFGLLISRFFHQVEGYFPNGAISPAGEKLSSEDGAPTPTDD